MPSIFSYFSEGQDSTENFSDGTPRGQDYAGWRPPADNSATHFTELEDKWMSIVDNYGQQMSPNAFWALCRALKHAEMEKATLAVDDARIAHWLADCQLDDLTITYRPDLFNEIRLQKTPDELAIMSKAALINEHALLSAAHGMQEGMTWAEVESIYMADMAQQGGRGVYLMCGLGELPAGKVRRGEPVLMDALGQYQHYHGDFGRCVVVGEPSAKHRKYHQAICAGWDTAQEILKPGISCNQVSVQVGDAVRKAGIVNFRDPLVHNLGLEHTDDPKPYGVMPQTKYDQVLLENMVVNVDLPHTEIGWGSVHMEDTVVITADGHQRLSQAAFDMIVND